MKYSPVQGQTLPPRARLAHHSGRFIGADAGLDYFAAKDSLADCCEFSWKVVWNRQVLATNFPFRTTGGILKAAPSRRDLIEGLDKEVEIASAFVASCALIRADSAVGSDPRYAMSESPDE